MSAAHDELRARVAEAAKFRCGFCLTQRRLCGYDLELEHLWPESKGGLTIEENLWLACRGCNAHKSDRTQVSDPESGLLVPLFNPRRQRWSEHFRWIEEGLLIVGITAVGRATVKALDLNRKSLVEARQAWRWTGLHPPAD